MTAFDILLEQSSGKTKYKRCKFALVVTFVILFVFGVVGLLVKFFVFDKLQSISPVNDEYFEETSGKPESNLLIGGKILQTGDIANSIEILTSTGCRKLPR